MDDKFTFWLDTSFYTTGLIDLDGDFMVRVRMEYVTATTFDIGVEVTWKDGTAREIDSIQTHSAVLPNDFLFQTTGAMTLHHAFLEMRGAGN